MEEPFKEGTRPLAGLTLGLLGCGDIGLQIVKAAKAMGLKTAAFKRDTSAPGETVGSCVLVCVWNDRFERGAPHLQCLDCLLTVPS